MATTEANTVIHPGAERVPPKVKQFEAAGFRAWPAASVHYDGAWAVRLTAGHPARRINSINILDLGDNANIPRRLGRAAQRFKAYGRPMTVRVSPLTPRALIDHMDAEGWSESGHSLVMTAPIKHLSLPETIEQLPLRDLSRFVDAAIATGAALPQWRAGLSEIIQSIEPPYGLFLQERGSTAVATALCVLDLQLAGLFEIATAQAHRRRGVSALNIAASLRWAQALGARTAWLQVEVANTAAVALYEKLGFQPFYSYHYRQLTGATS